MEGSGTVNEGKNMKRGFLALLTVIASAPLCSALAFELTSPDISADKPIAQKFIYNSSGCAGDNISPELAWGNPPPNVKSFALLVLDPDAPTSKPGFVHWIVTNIPVSATGLPQGAGSADGKKLPAGSVQMENHFGDAAWDGPCPPIGAGAHRYIFTIYALGVEKLQLPKNPKASDLASTLDKNALAKTAITSRYGR
jgi:Raf kinase inhibitor-like YbhB/YbcL family protein